VGLVLATPITACVVVLSKYIPGLFIFGQLLGEHPALYPHVRLYQCLLARNEGEAENIVEEHRKERSLMQTCNELLLGVLLMLKRDLATGLITSEDGEFVADTLREIVDDLQFSPNTPATSQYTPVALVAFPLRDRLDEIAMRMLRVVLNEEQLDLEVLSATRPIGERIAEIEALAPAAVCIPSLPPGDLATTRHICRHLRARLPEINIVVGRLGAPDLTEQSRQLLRKAGARHVVTAFDELTRVLTASVQQVRPATLPELDEIRVANS
jgi:hypothetical protein